MTKLYVNRAIIAKNQKTGERNPPISVMENGRHIYAADAVELHGVAHVVYKPDKPLSNGARLWIECNAPECRVVKPRKRGLTKPTPE